MNSVGVPEREPHVPAQAPPGLLDRVERLPRVWALVIAVLDDQAAGGRTPDVIDFLIQRRQRQLAVVRHRAAGHGGFRWLRGIRLAGLARSRPAGG
jgi:hypothetical protein